MAVQVVDVADDLQPFAGRQRLGIDPRSCDDDRPKPGNLRSRERVGVDHAAEEMPADARSADADDADPLVLAVAQLGAKRFAVGERCGVESGHVAGEVEVLLGPIADQRQIGPEPVGDEISGLPTKIARSRRRGKRAMCSTISAL